MNAATRSAMVSPALSMLLVIGAHSLNGGAEVVGVEIGAAGADVADGAQRGSVMIRRNEDNDKRCVPVSDGNAVGGLCCGHRTNLLIRSIRVKRYRAIRCSATGTGFRSSYGSLD